MPSSLDDPAVLIALMLQLTELQRLRGPIIVDDVDTVEAALGDLSERLMRITAIPNTTGSGNGA